MSRDFPTKVGANDGYFDRTPERLVLEGYRHWSVGYETGSIEPWELAWNLYSKSLGSTEGRQALGELSNYIRTLRKCATCPLRSYPFNSTHLCIEECLTMGLIAGLQHDVDTAELCLKQIACPMNCYEIQMAAASFANTLKCFDQVMLPIPSRVIEDILSRATSTYH